FATAVATHVAASARRAASQRPAKPNDPVQPPGRPDRQNISESRNAGPVGCNGWILMKALVCDDGDGTQPPPTACLLWRPSLCVPIHRLPTRDSPPASIGPPGPCTSSSSTATATPASAAISPLPPSRSCAPCNPSATACSSPANASTPGTGSPTP